MEILRAMVWRSSELGQVETSHSGELLKILEQSRNGTRAGLGEDPFTAELGCGGIGGESSARRR